MKIIHIKFTFCSVGKTGGKKQIIPYNDLNGGADLMWDMTKGNPFLHILRLSLPLFICVIFGQSGLIHSFAAGRFLGEEALSVIGNVSALTEVFMLFAYGMNVGGSVVVSHMFGAKSHAGLRLAVTTLFLSGAVISVIIMIIGLCGSGILLRLINTPEAIFDGSKSYLFVFLYGLVFMYIFNICTGIFTALGDSITPGIFLIISNFLNIILCILSAKYTDFGVTGLAWAAFISQAAAAICAFLTLREKLKCITENDEKNAPVFTLIMFRRLFCNIIPAMLHSSVAAVGNVLIQGVINPMGTAAIAGCALGGKINGFASSCIDSVPDGNSAFAAQNIGGGHLLRVKKGFTAGLVQVLVLSGVFTAAVLLFSDTIITFFTEQGTSEESVSIARYYIISAACVYPLMGVKYLCDDILRAAGRMKLYLLTTVNNLALRVIIVFTLAPFLGVYAVFIGWSTALGVTAVISVIIYKKEIWKQGKLVKNAA
jgi:putative MATE family efflux protein